MSENLFTTTTAIAALCKTMPTLVDLPGTQSPKEYESCSSATGAIKALRKGLAATASGDRGAINLWRDDTGQLRGERFRDDFCCYRNRRSSGRLRQLAFGTPRHLRLSRRGNRFQGTAVERTKSYFGCEVIVTQIPQEWHPFRWRFSINRDGQTWDFCGVPNYCESARQAFRRAWWRAKWISEGTFDKHYCS